MNARAVAEGLVAGGARLASDEFSESLLKGPLRLSLDHGLFSNVLRMASRTTGR